MILGVVVYPPHIGEDATLFWPQFFNLQIILLERMSRSETEGGASRPKKAAQEKPWAAVVSPK